MATLEMDAKGLFGGNVSKNRARYKKGWTIHIETENYLSAKIYIFYE